ncbi:hypothetical protein [Streptococcus minor]|uniref:hypothetical protein n=1 Tax=Streptococcus minor TaxID=229549 RepID=UPI00035DE7A2|nr:hypothetical protein [Streptococcus minor]
MKKRPAQLVLNEELKEKAENANCNAKHLLGSVVFIHDELTKVSVIGGVGNQMPSFSLL